MPLSRDPERRRVQLANLAANNPAFAQALERGDHPALRPPDPQAGPPAPPPVAPPPPYTGPPTVAGLPVRTRPEEPPHAPAPPPPEPDEPEPGPDEPDPEPEPERRGFLAGFFEG
jgi:hypothetical protein